MLVDALISKAGMPEQHVNWLEKNASILYKVYTIPKRDGKFRTIEQPTKELKAIQRWLVKRVIAKFPVSECATAYSIGSGIRKNAEAHKESAFTLRMDFQGFFPGFEIGSIKKFVLDGIEFVPNLNERDLKFFCNIVCRHGRLTIGAPSSPAITNAMMHSFDQRLLDYCTLNDLVYTRYADDLFISSKSPGKLGVAEQHVRLLAAEFSYGKLIVNEGKTAFLSRRYRRTVTGLVITPDGRISLGRERKREIHALVHKFKMGTLEADSVGRARGLVAFALDVEPEFVSTLRTKYGSDVIESVLNRKK